MQVVENTCIGHEISFKKISEPKHWRHLTYTSNSTTTRNAVLVEDTTSLAADVVQKQQAEPGLSLGQSHLR